MRALPLFILIAFAITLFSVWGFNLLMDYLIFEAYRWYDIPADIPSQFPIIKNIFGIFFGLSLSLKYLLVAEYGGYYDE